MATLDTGTIIEVVGGGLLAAFLAKLLQAQYEGRIGDLKERIAEQSGQIKELIKAVGADEGLRGD